MNGQPYPLLDLFSGYGGFSLAFEAVAQPGYTGPSRAGCESQPESAVEQSGDGHPNPVFRTIGFSEIEPYACALLAHRFPGVPNLGPVQSVTRDRVLRECGVLPVVVTGGFPCQPHSTAGKRLAGADDRDLWAECVRVLREFRPRVAVFENVPGLLTSKSPAPDGRDGKGLFFNRVLSDLAEIGFACAWETLSAAQVGAPHKRDRIWLVCVDERGVADSASDGAGERSGIRGTDGRPGSALLGEPGAAGEEGIAVGLADRLGAGLEGHAGDGARCVRQEREVSQPDRPVGEVGVPPGAFWPAAHGLWPARPGEAQYEWEPSRVVGHATSERPGPRGTEPAGLVGAAGFASASASANGGEVEPLLGGNADGSAARLDPAPAEVREAPSDTVNRTQRLKALGNGIVPACAYPFAVAIRDYLDGDL